MLNPYRNAKRDIDHALEHFDALTQSYDAEIEETHRGTMTLKSILDWDDYKAWGQFRAGELRGLSLDDLRGQLGSFRGSTWAHNALDWIKDGVPAIVLVEGKTHDGKPIRFIGDGRGRTNFAVGFGLKTLPVIILREIARKAVL